MGKKQRLINRQLRRICELEHLVEEQQRELADVHNQLNEAIDRMYPRYTWTPVGSPRQA